MKKCRFLWSAHRITERQKAGKSRSIKGKQLKNSRSQDVQFLPDVEIPCPECRGSRYAKEAGQIF